MRITTRVIGTLIGLQVFFSGLDVQAADREVRHVTWSEFQRQVTAGRLTNVQIFLSNGAKPKAKILRVEDDSLVTTRSRSTGPWATNPNEARIPKELIVSVRVSGRVGNRGMIGALIGLGAGAALTTGTWAYYRGVDREAGFYNTAAMATSIPAGALAGYWIGRFSSKHGPEFVIQPESRPRVP